MLPIARHGALEMRRSFQASEQNKSVKSELGLWHLLCTYVVKHAQGYSVLGPTSKKGKGKQACTCDVDCNQRHALQHSSFAAPPGSCDLLFTVQVQPVRATTPCALSRKKRGQKTRKSPTRQGGVVHPVPCCVWSAALLWHCWHTWYSTNLCEFANVGQVLVR